MVEDSDNNPWASAAATNANSAKSSFRISPGQGHENIVGDANDDEDTESIDPQGCAHKTLYRSLQIWHGLDVLAGILLLVYASSQKDHISTVAFLTILLVAVLVSVRSLAGTLALATDHACQRLGLKVSAGTSPILACTWFVLMFINLVAPQHVRKYLQQHDLLWKFLQTWEASHKGTLTLILLGIFLLECVRWQLVMRLHYELERVEFQDDARARTTAERQIRSPHRPWWWAKHSISRTMDPNDPLSNSLLPVTADRTGEDYDSNNWSFFGRRRNKRNNNPRSGQRSNSNVRDDASVDFASVQEEWASRTEEDPFWWSRDDDDENPPTREISWPAEGDRKSPARKK